MQNEKNVLEELLQARIPEKYETASIFQREMLEEIFARLDFMTLKPRTVLDVGCATGNTAMALKKRYSDAEIIAIDPSSNMLEHAKKNSAPIEWICTPLTALPLQDHSVDLIVANGIFPWCDALQDTLKEWRRILRPKGLLMITTLGPDTLRELHDFPLAFPHFMDMHTVGDLLTQAGFVEPVLDVDYFTLTYSDQKKLWHELQVTGMITGNVESIQLKKIDEQYPLSYEMIFAHAWGVDFKVNGAEVRIPVSQIKKGKQHW